MIYLVSLAKATERRDRMLRRFGAQGIEIRLVEAYDETSSVVLSKVPDNASLVDRKVAACLSSHLKALQAFLDTGEGEAIVCEDDVRPVLSFESRWREIRTNIPEGTPCVSLSYLVWTWMGFFWAGKELSRENLCTMGWDTWGTQMYWIRRSYAEECVERFDRPIADIITDEIRTAELITRSKRHVGALIAYPPLALEDLTGSIMVPEAGNSNHGQAVMGWNQEEYPF